MRHINLTDRSLTLGDGGRLSYTDLVLAVGSRARTLPWLPPSDDVVYLRTLDDADRLRQLLTPGARIVVVGGGFIGLEVAAAARSIGADVTAVELAVEPLNRILGDRLGRAVGDLHRSHGVALFTGETVIAVSHSKHGDSLVTTNTGRRLPYDALIVGIGAEPADEIAAQAGLAVNSGIIVDQTFRTAAPNVYAIGDVSRHDHPVHGPLRVEHWDSARRHAAAVAAAIVGKNEPYTALPWFWSDQYNVNFQYIGHAESFDSIFVRGDIDAFQFTAFYCFEGHVRAAFGAGCPRDIRPAGRLISSRSVISGATLADPTADLRHLAKMIIDRAPGRGGDSDAALPNT